MPFWLVNDAPKHKIAGSWHGDNMEDVKTGAVFFADTTHHLHQPVQGAVYLGLDEQNREIGLTLERHALTIAGSGAGKGVGLIVPNGLRWADNLLIVEPKGESVAALWEPREAMGQKVVVLDPFRIAAIPDRLRGSFNPLAAITTADIDGREHLQMIADGLVRRSDPRHEEWYAGAATILAGILAYVVETAPHEHRNLTALRTLLMQPKDELHADAQRMQGCSAFGRLARAAGIQIQTALETEKGMERDFLGAARRYTEWLDSDPIAATLKESSFDLTELKTGKISLFVILPPQYLETHAAYLRLFVRASIEAMMKSGVRKSGRCLFILDEFYSLGRLDIVSKSAGLMRDYGLHLWPIMQDIDQLRSLYSDMSETYFANADAVTFFGISDQSTLEYISRKVGVITLDDIRARPPKRLKLVSDQLAAKAGQSVIAPRHISPPPTQNPKAAGALFLGAEFINSLNHASYSFESQQTAAAQTAVARLREEEQRMDEQAMREYQHEMQRRGEPRLTPDALAKLIGKGMTDTIARAMIVFLRGGDILRIKPHPYFLPKPDAPPDPTKALADTLNRQIEAAGMALQEVLEGAATTDANAGERGTMRMKRAFGTAGLMAVSTPVIVIAPNWQLLNVGWNNLLYVLAGIAILALGPAVLTIMAYAISYRLADWFAVVKIKNQIEQAAAPIGGLYARLLTETAFDIDAAAEAAIPDPFKRIIHGQREQIARLARQSAR